MPTKSQLQKLRTAVSAARLALDEAISRGYQPVDDIAKAVTSLTAAYEALLVETADRMASKRGKR